MRDVMVAGGGVTIATRDHGGTGTPLILIPGAGGNLLGFEPIVPFLLPGHRIVAMDMRCHGGSGDAPWSLDGALDDVRAVIAHTACPGPS